MKYGLAFANTGPATDPAYASRFVQAAEAAGFESVWTVEHVIWPDQYDSVYPYHPSGKMAGDRSTPIPDPLVWLTWVGAATSTIRLGTGILLLPERNPVVLAKEAATVAHLTSGRLELGIGIGWLREEFDALGIPFAGRAARTDEYVRVLRELWTNDSADFEGEFVTFSDVSSNPKPPGNHIPITVGGHSAGAARRAGTLGDAFWPAVGGFDELGELFDITRQTAADAGRNPADVTLCGSPPHGIRQLDEDVEALAGLGVERMIIPAFFFFAEDPAPGLRDVMDRLRS